MNTEVNTPVAGVEIDELAEVAEKLHDCPLLFDADGNTIAGFKVVDANSERFRKAKRDAEVQAVKRSSTRRKSIDAKTDEGANTLLDLAARNTKAIVKACVREWYGFANGGQPVPLTSDSLEKVLTLRPTFVDVAMAKIQESASFFESSKTP